MTMDHLRFSADLGQCLDAADRVFMDNTELDGSQDFWWQYVTPNGGDSQIEVRIDDQRYYFDPMTAIDVSEGEARVCDAEGEEHTFTFIKERSLDSNDL